MCGCVRYAAVIMRKQSMDQSVNQFGLNYNGPLMDTCKVSPNHGKMQDTKLGCLVASKGTRPENGYCYEQLICLCLRPGLK